MMHFVDLNGRAEFFAREVQRHTHRHNFIRRNALEVVCMTCCLYGCIWKSRQNNEFFLAVEFHRQNGSVELSLRSAKKIGLCSSSIGVAGFLPP